MVSGCHLAKTRYHSTSDWTQQTKISFARDMDYAYIGPKSRVPGVGQDNQSFMDVTPNKYTTTAYKNAPACNCHIRAYSPSLANNASCVPASWILASSIYLMGASNQSHRVGEGKGTHRMRSAWRVKPPNLCEEKIMVLLPRSARSLSNKSGVHKG